MARERRNNSAAAASATASASGPIDGAPAISGTAKKSATTVTVGCKIPNGIVLQLCKPTKWIEETPSGSLQRTRFDKVGPRYYVQGPAYPVGTIPKGYGEKPPIAGGFALTTGIPKDFWDEWLDQNKESTFVTGGQVFAHDTFDAAQGDGREMAHVKSGFEPLPEDLDPTKDPRLPRPVMGLGVEMVKPADEMRDRRSAA